MVGRRDREAELSTKGTDSLLYQNTAADTSVGITAVGRRINTTASAAPFVCCCRRRLLFVFIYMGLQQQQQHEQQQQFAAFNYRLLRLIKVYI